MKYPLIIKATCANICRIPEKFQTFKWCNAAKLLMCVYELYTQ